MVDDDDVSNYEDDVEEPSNPQPDGGSEAWPQEAPPAPPPEAP